MSAVTKTETHTARERHRCSWCWQHINAGERYKRYRYFGADTGTVKAHEECYDAIMEAAEEEGGWVEWTPGQERPEKEEK